MVDEPESEAVAEAPAPRAEPERGSAGTADAPPTHRPVPAPRKLTQTELEALRSRLQRKFH